MSRIQRRRVLYIIQRTHECMHRFCQECIEKYLRLGQKECPKCRVKVSSRRALRPDPAFDKIIQKFYPDIVSERVRVVPGHPISTF